MEVLLATHKTKISFSHQFSKDEYTEIPTNSYQILRNETFTEEQKFNPVFIEEDTLYAPYEILSLSRDIWTFGICSYLSIKDLKNVRLVSRWFYREVVIYPIWNQVYPLDQLHKHYRFLKTLSSQQRTIELKKCNISTVVARHGKIPTIALKILRFYSIRHLILSRSCVKDAHLKVSLPSLLLYLNLESCLVTNAIISYLPPNLKILNLSRTNITDEGLKLLPQSLIKLNLSKCEITNNGIESLTTPFLQELYLNECKQLKDPIQKCISKFPLIKLGLQEVPISIEYANLPKTLKELNIYSSTPRNIAFPGSNLQIYYDSLVETTTPLIYAISRKTDSVEELIHCGCSVNLANNVGLTPLMAACSNESIVKILVSNGARINDKNKSFQTPLLLACLTSNPQIVEFLLQNSADFQICNPIFETSNIDNLKLLIKYGCSVNQVNSHGNTALMIACKDHRMERIELLLKSGANPNFIQAHDNLCPLALSCAMGPTSVCEMLLQYGANVNGNPGAISPLTYACKNNQRDLVKLLIEKGASPNFNQDSSDYSALIYLCEDGNLELVELLLKAGVEINYQSVKCKKTALIAACEFDRYEIAQLLLSNGAQINCCLDNSIQATPLFITSSYNYLRLVDLLLGEPTIEVDKLYTPDKITCLFRACEKGFFDVAQCLINKKADVNKPRQKDGATPLYISCQKGYIRLVRLLLQAGADSNIATLNSITPLEVCISRQDINLQNLLIQYGAKANYYTSIHF